jgi:alkyldihydroxyacetonephosphate synthase
MKERGYTIGHEPDSIEFSTLGGWIATKASGMKRNKYGNIEDIVQDVHVIGSNFGCSQSACQGDDKATSTRTFGRVSTGMDLSTLMFGSEGNCGIITSAIIKIWPLPETTAYNGIIFASFEDGLKFVREVAKLSSSKPASVRLLDNEQFRLGQALRKERAGFAWIVEYFMKMASAWTNSFSSSKAVCATIAYEGSADEVKYQQQRIGRIASSFGGISTGPRTGRAGYDLTFAIAYLRDFAMSYHFLAESFETFVPWSRVEEVIVRTKERIIQEHRKRFLPGNPIISSRVTQLYDNGACVYFYFCMNYEGIAEPSRVYGEIEAAARDEILLCGGSLSHHHGVGKLRAPFMPRISSETHRRSLLDVKKSLDPLDVFGVRNGPFDDEEWRGDTEV